MVYYQQLTAFTHDFRIKFASMNFIKFNRTFWVSSTFVCNWVSFTLCGSSCEYASKINKWKLVEPKNRNEKQNCCSFGIVPRMMLEYTLNRESHVLCIWLFAIPWHSRGPIKNIQKTFYNIAIEKKRNSSKSEKRHMKI